MAFYDFPEYYDHLHRARDEASHRPAALLEVTGGLLQNAVTCIGIGAVLLPYGGWLPIALFLGSVPWRCSLRRSSRRRPSCARCCRTPASCIRTVCFYEPDRGRICIDGTDIREQAAPEVRRLVSVLCQEPVRYASTVAENVAPGEASVADRATVARAIHAAGAEAIVARLPRGSETLPGKWFDEGVELSSGEWQRLARARALLRTAPILLLDEPTSAMDSWAEAGWFDRFRQAAAGRRARPLALPLLHHPSRDDAIMPEAARRGGILVDFQPMSPEDMQQTMQFLLRQQAQFAADLAGGEARWTERFDLVTGGLVGLTQIVGQLAAAQQRTDEQLRETDHHLRDVESHLNVVITMFERHLREDHGHTPS